MKVSELIEILQTVNPELEVFVEGYEGGFDDIRPYITIQTFEKNVNEEWYYGPHELNSIGHVTGIVLKGVRKV